MRYLIYILGLKAYKVTESLAVYLEHTSVEKEQKEVWFVIVYKFPDANKNISDQTVHSARKIKTSKIFGLWLVCYRQNTDPISKKKSFLLICVTK